MDKETLIKILNKKESEHKNLLDEYNSCNDKALKFELSGDLISLEFDIEHIKHILNND